MPTDSAALMVECQMALGMTQSELGALLGKERRTIQRWQDGGVDLMPDQAQTLADALRPKRPDLADRVLELGRKAASLAGIALPASPAAIARILQAAAQAGGTSPEAVRAVVTAAFLEAREAGVDVAAVAQALKS